MSRQISVFSTSRQVIPMADIVSGMAARGISVRWVPEPLDAMFPSSSGAPWDSGDLVLGDGGGHAGTIRLSQDFTEEEVRTDVAETYRDQMSEEQRRAVLGDGVEYRLGAGPAISRDRDRALVHLADLLAERGAGPILDHQENRVYDGVQYRAAHLDALGAG